MAADRDLVPEGNLVDVLGLEGFEFDGEGEATLRMPVHDGVKQPFGIVHGGAFAALAETVCSRATYEAVAPKLALGQANETVFMRAVRSGTIEARARALHRGGTSWVWDVEMRDGEGRLCASSRLIIAVREGR
ncbi:MAG TPA: PaaI family thioesterase [Solirubrobacterales bacterium]|nr:PaaI family thioesterase [Solirubrobacterales bacterium]